MFETRLKIDLGNLLVVRPNNILIIMAGNDVTGPDNPNWPFRASMPNSS